MFTAPDKRASQFSGDQPPNIPKRCQKKAHAASIFSIDSIVDISLDDNIPESASNHGEVHYTDHHDLRDSGISITENSNLNNFNNISYEDYELRPQLEMNINSSPPVSSPQFDNPPPIPPKSSSGNQNSEGNLGSTHQRNDSGVSVDRVAPPENYSIPRLQLERNGTDNVDESNC